MIRVYDANLIADYVIWYANEIKDYSMNNLKLQKVLWFLQADSLLAFDRELFYNDIEAWDFGPVVPDVYHRFKHIGTCRILAGNEAEQSQFLIAKKDKNVINFLVEILKEYSSVGLTDMTMRQAPWKYYYQCKVCFSSKTVYCKIPTNEIKNYFKRDEE